MSTIRRTSVVIICLALVAVIALLARTILQTNQLDNAAQELAIAATQEAFEARYPTTLDENAHPDFKAAYPPEALVGYMQNALRRLGPLNSLVAIRGSTDISAIPSGQAASTAQYELDLDFQNSPARVDIGMETVDGRWLITSFRIAADLLRN